MSNLSTFNFTPVDLLGCGRMSRQLLQALKELHPDSIDVLFHGLSNHKSNRVPEFIKNDGLVYGLSFNFILNLREKTLPVELSIWKTWQGRCRQVRFYSVDGGNR